MELLYEDGKLESTVSYKNDLKDGKSIYYSSQTGKKEREESWKRDVENGLWIWWNDKGRKIKEGSSKLGKNMAYG